MSIIDNDKMRIAGALVANSYFRQHYTGCCGKFCVEDDELLTLYLSPTDFSRHIHLASGTACPFCQQGDWTLNEIHELKTYRRIGLVYV